MAMRLHTPLPPLDGATEWLNSKPDLDAIQGHPLLVHFWAISCHICHTNMPKLNQWRSKFVPKGLRLISIHCPRMKTDTDLEEIRTACEHYGIIEPCGIDNLHKIKRAFDTQIWPAYFLFDAQTKLKARAAGKSGLTMLEPILGKLCK